MRKKDTAGKSVEKGKRRALRYKLGKTKQAAAQLLELLHHLRHFCLVHPGISGIDTIHIVKVDGVDGISRRSGD